MGWIVDLNRCLKQAFETRGGILGQAGRGRYEYVRMWESGKVGMY
jgi:hypothetical protein